MASKAETTTHPHEIAAPHGAAIPTLRQAVVVAGLHVGALAAVVLVHRGDFVTVGTALRLTLPAVCVLLIAQMFLMSRWRVQERIGFRRPELLGWVLGLPLLFMSVAVAVRGGFVHLDGVSVHTFIVFLVALGVAACAEELTFRGFLLAALLDRMSKVGAIAVSSAAFGAAHAITLLGGMSIIGVAPQLLATALFGGLLALIRLRVGSLLPGIVLHFVWNFAVLSGQASGGVSPQLAAASAVAAAFAVGSAIVLALIYRHMQGSRMDGPSGCQR